MRRQTGDAFLTIATIGVTMACMPTWMQAMLLYAGFVMVLVGGLVLLWIWVDDPYRGRRVWSPKHRRRK